jgi:hypothetical protein
MFVNDERPQPALGAAAPVVAAPVCRLGECGRSCRGQHRPSRGQLHAVNGDITAFRVADIAHSKGGHLRRV